MLREKPNWQSQEGESTNAEHRGGMLRSSDEAAVMEVEQRERVVQQNKLVNQDLGGTSESSKTVRDFQTRCI